MKNENRREALLACALTLFSEKGFDSVGVAQIAEEAQVTKPTLYYFFKSKEGLFQAILDMYYQPLNDELRHAAEYDARPKEYYDDVYPTLKAVAQTYYAFAQAHPEFFRLFLSLLFSPPTASVTEWTAPYEKEQYDILSEMFEKILTAHQNLKGNERRFARYFAALIHSEIGFWMRNEVTLDEQNADFLVRRFMHGIF